MNSPMAQSQKEARDVLLAYLQNTDFLTFERVMKRLLYKSGYVSVQMIGRTHKRGRTPKGGLDMTARSTTELSSSLTIAQVKQYQRVVSRRFVDELRGAMLRLGAGQGLLLTLSKFSAVAHAAATETPIAPITLIEGEEILDLLFAYRIGVKLENRIWRLDEAFLEKLQSIGTAKDCFSLDSSPETAISTNVMQTNHRNSHKPSGSNNREVT